MTSYELIRAHQGSLTYLNTNLPFDRSGLGTKELAEDRYHGYLWEPDNPWGLCHLRMIARALGRPLHEHELDDIKLYYMGA